MLKRFRTSRGFGVHSPLAFKFITGPLRDTKAVYYATSSLPDPASRRWMRVAVWTGCRTARRIGAPLPPLDNALEAAGVRLTVDASELTVAVGLTEPIPLPASGAVMLIDTDPEVLANMTGAHTSGLMTFSDAREHYILLRSDLPRQHFNISMR